VNIVEKEQWESIFFRKRNAILAKKIIKI